GSGGGGGEGRAGSEGGRVGAKSLSLYELSKLKERVKPEYLDAVAADLDHLVPKDFLAIYSITRLARIPRSLEGLMIRFERARLAPEKDKAKVAQLEPFAFELTRLDSALKSGTRTGCASPRSCPGAQYQFPNSRSDRSPSPAARNQGHGIASPISVSAEKRAAVDELRWMIEEFKLALFAPEIKTAFPISAVRLARKVAEIDAMS
ncbi:MAG: DUF3418 domain-containing protein, partial [Candidatus Aminicenantales bacterium]